MRASERNVPLGLCLTIPHHSPPQLTTFVNLPNLTATHSQQPHTQADRDRFRGKPIHLQKKNKNKQTQTLHFSVTLAALTGVFCSYFDHSDSAHSFVHFLNVYLN